MNTKKLLSILAFLTLTACNGGSESKTAEIIDGDDTFTITASANNNGAISPENTTANQGSTSTFTITPDSGYSIDTVSGCGGALKGNSYVTAGATADCTVSISFILDILTVAAVPTLSYTPVKGFKFDWSDVSGASFYRLLENHDGTSGFSQLGSDVPQGTATVTEIIPLHKRVNAQYILQSCSAARCIDSSPINVAGNLASAIGYIKGGNTGSENRFGSTVGVSSEGNTLAVGAHSEFGYGAVYIYIREGSTWSQQARITASNNGNLDGFGSSLSLSDDGNTLAVGAWHEASDETGIGGIGNNDNALASGATYVFSRTGIAWSQQAYIKASNAESYDFFGQKVSLSGDGNTLAVGARKEDSNDAGIGGTGADNSVSNSGAAYVFSRTGIAWSQQAYIKASSAGFGEHFGTELSLNYDGNTLAIGGSLGIGVSVFIRTGAVWSSQIEISQFDEFGRSLSLSSDGNTLAVGAWQEDSNEVGVGGTGVDNSASNSGAAYIYKRTGAIWAQQAYIKASNTEADDQFGYRVSLSGDGKTLAVAAWGEDSNEVGVGGTSSDNSTLVSGAVYIFTQENTTWAQKSYIKASNTGFDDRFGASLSLSHDGDTLVVGASHEDSNETGVGGTGVDNSASNSGAAYVY